MSQLTLFVSHVNVSCVCDVFLLVWLLSCVDHRNRLFGSFWLIFNLSVCEQTRMRMSCAGWWCCTAVSSTFTTLAPRPLTSSPTTCPTSKSRSWEGKRSSGRCGSLTGEFSGTREYLEKSPLFICIVAFQFGFLKILYFGYPYIFLFLPTLQLVFLYCLCSHHQIPKQIPCMCKRTW